MGGWDYYCFICAAGFHVPYEIEDGEEAESSDDDDDGEQGDEVKFRPKQLFPREKVAERLQWLSNFRTIGQNRNATGLSQCYVSGAASEEDYGQADIERGSHPNAQNLEESYVSCYRNGDEETGDLPVHDKCLALLCRVFAQARGDKYNWQCDDSTISFPFELDALFSCLAGARRDYGSSLELDHTLYVDQYFAVEWDRIYDYFDPSELKELDFSQTIHLEDETTDHPSAGSDPFDALPNELLTCILDLVSQDDLIPFMEASPSIRRLANEDKFWEHRLKLDAPWLWECRIPKTDNVHWHWLYNAVMMQVRKPLQTAENGVELSGLANRVRIWRVCQQILGLYLEENSLTQPDKKTSDYAEGATCQYLPVVANQQSPDFKGETAFFFDNPGEMHAAKQLTLQWGTCGELQGISLKAGSKNTIFGHIGLTDHKQTILNIQAEDWIEKLVLNISEVDSWTTKTYHGDKTHRILAITGIAIWQLSHGVTVFGKEDGYKRLLEPQQGNGIVGLKCQFAEGRITHLGILEHPGGLTKVRPANDPRSLNLLWDGHLPPAELRFKEYGTGYWMSPASWDLVPMQTLIFGTTDQEQSTVTGFGASMDLRCLEIYRADGSSEHIGSREGPMKLFKIDGPGGERIAGFEMTIGALPVGITLVTTHGRQAVFGRRADNARSAHTSEHGFGVAGLYCSFEYNSIPERQLSSLGLIQSPHIARPPMDDRRQEDGSGLVWEPCPLPTSWLAAGPLYGQGQHGEVATWIDFSRPVAKLTGLFPLPEWMANIEIGGFKVHYSDDNTVEPVGHFGFPPQQWPTGPDATPEDLRKMQRYPGMSTSLSRERDTGVSHVTTDAEALSQPTIWNLDNGERIAAVTVWADDFLNGLQFHSDRGKDSPRWGRCGGTPSGVIRVGGDEAIVGVKIVMGSTRLGYHAPTLAPQAVQALAVAS